jgi:predicted Zn-dependent peptidase
MFSKTILDNGIRVLSEELPGSRSVCLGIWVQNGSRHEARHQNGISHFIEHLLFKGTERRTAAQIAEEIDAVGGVLNAFTGKEYTCYYAKVLDENLSVATGLLTDIYLSSVFDSEEIDRERSVILQEISQVEDTPDDYVHELFNLDVFKDHPLGRPICGESSTVSHFRREDFLSFWRERYLPDRVIVAAAGHLSHESLVREMESTLGKIPAPASNGSAASEDTPVLSPGLFQHAKPLEQAHLCVGLPGIHQAHLKRDVFYVLNTLLGGGMSSRLFQEIREKRGRVYSIYSFQSSYSDTGYLGIYAGTSVEWVEEVMDLILKEMRRVAQGDVGAEEIERSKSQLTGNMTLGLETSDSWMGHIAKNEIYFGRAMSLDEIFAGIRSVSRDDIVELADEIFQPQGIALTVLGDIDGKNLNLKI